MKCYKVYKISVNSFNRRETKILNYGINFELMTPFRIACLDKVKQSYVSVKLLNDIRFQRNRYAIPFLDPFRSKPF